MFKVLGSEPSFDLSECLGLPIPPRMLDLVLLAVCVEDSSADARELAVVREDLSCFRVFVA
jgi:hypothetical protein